MQSAKARKIVRTTTSKATRRRSRAVTPQVDPLRRLKAGCHSCSLPCLRLVREFTGDLGWRHHRDALGVAEFAIFVAYDTYDRAGARTFWAHVKPYITKALQKWMADGSAFAHTLSAEDREILFRGLESDRYLVLAEQAKAVFFFPGGAS